MEGPKGKLHWKLPRDIRASVEENQVSLVREAETRGAKALHGLSRSLVHNMVQGVSEGFHQAPRDRRSRFQGCCPGIEP